ncbi:MAG: hypothetical protein QNJ63_00375 [Calothrix sp. MO_192.B10]|nr:hypothetical protein [Calothrix sp. MO_192.B10]
MSSSRLGEAKRNPTRVRFLGLSSPAVQQAAIYLISQYGSVKKKVGWVERSETQQKADNVGFRSSTQPTPGFCLCSDTRSAGIA